jgi:formate hydrogenlyase subunit 6/NADH:ubiquinone oxidoreductase subunit I
MIKFDFNKNCCGCTACKNSCPTGAIQMTENSEGFLLPVVDKTKCVDCGKCDTVCPFLNSENGEKVQLLKSKTYLYYLKDEKIRMKVLQVVLFMVLQNSLWKTVDMFVVVYGIMI